VARRVVTIDTAGEDGDRHPASHHRTAVRAAVDAERPPGDYKKPKSDPQPLGVWDRSTSPSWATGHDITPELPVESVRPC
jgi:hypothetical protein